MTHWAEEEIKTLSLGDVRLDKRMVTLTEQLAQRPGASIAQACGDWSQTQAAYRFLAHEDTSGEAVLEAHGPGELHPWWRNPSGKEFYNVFAGRKSVSTTGLLSSFNCCDR